MTLVEEYKKSLKMAEAEELLDLAFYRPLAFGLVKIIYRLPITPNQVTFLSLLAGLVAAYYFSTGAPEAFAIGAIWFLVANVLDCSDGQLARLQKSGTPLGRIVDGIVDYLVTITVFICLGIGLTKHTGDPSIWFLVIAAGLSSAFHAILFDYHQQEYISNVRGERNFLDREIERCESELKKLKAAGGSLFRRGMLALYLHYARLQQSAQPKKDTAKQYPPDIYRTANRAVMRWWSYLGSTMNRSLLIVAALFQDPAIFLWVVIVVGNLWLLVALLWQRSSRRWLEAAVSSGSFRAPTGRNAPAGV